MRVTREQAAENRRRVVEAAGTLFREHGFDGVGVADIMKAAGLTHGGFYGQFGSKDDLMAEALGAILGRSAESWRARAERAPDDPFGALVGYYLSRTHSGSAASGCAVAALGGEVMRAPEAVRASFSDGFEALVEVLASTIEARDEAERRQKALAVMAQITGAVILARAFADRARSDELLEAVRAALGVGRKGGQVPPPTGLAPSPSGAGESHMAILRLSSG